MAKATGLARATARRALITYGHLGLVAQSRPGAVTLTPGSSPSATRPCPAPPSPTSPPRTSRHSPSASTSRHRSPC
ncbi:hypothetical protein [Streptomyces sp. NPDC047706]|uniref:hypothetical protein n=1 Tax=Streptomyces sp. NPDC047706 TaxID=3365486 RepID=UPI0037109056